MNKKNCNGYESMFIFLSEEDFKKHLKECESCRLEHEKMNKVSELIQEAKPYLLTQQRQQQKKTNILKTACTVFALFIAGSFLPVLMHSEVGERLAMSSPSIEEMGLPVDEYGLLMVD